jgi:hypothetical protein
VAEVPDKIVAQLRDGGEVRHSPTGDEEISFLAHWADLVGQLLEWCSFKLSLEQLAEGRGEDACEEGCAGRLNRHESILEVEVEVSDEWCLVSHHAGCS